MNLVRRFVHHLLPLLLAVLFLFALKQVDVRFFPVITNFNITDTKVDVSKVVISGTMHKRRDCEFIQVIAYDSSKALIPITFMEDASGDRTKTREVGFQIWGPWSLPNNRPGVITLYARHQCNPFWQTTAELIHFTVI